MSKNLRSEQNASIYRAILEWKDDCLIGDWSILAQPREALWTYENLIQIEKAFIDAPDVGDDDFFVKLQKQLSSSGTQVTKLAAELFWVLNLFPSASSIKPSTKRDAISKIWSWCGDSLDIGYDMLSDAVLSGLGSVGTAFLTGRPRELAFLILVVKEIKARDVQGRTELLSDPWRFGEWLATRTENRQLRHVLPHLLFPDHFECISSMNHKTQIWMAITGKSKTDAKALSWIKIDEALWDYRVKWEREHPGMTMDWYGMNTPLPWNSSGENFGQEGHGEEELATPLEVSAPVVFDPSAIATPVNVIYYGPPGTGKTHTLEHEILPQYTGIDASKELSENAIPFPMDRSWWEALALAMLKMKGSATVDALMEHPFIVAKATKMNRTDSPYIRNTLWSELQAHTHLDSKTVEQKFRRPPFLFEKDEGKPAIFKLIPQWSKNWEEYDLQIGTLLNSKEFKAWTPSVGVTNRTPENRNRYEFVTFHQAYSYEEFVEGLRPQVHPDTRQVTYDIHRGVFQRICERAKSDPANRYAMIIDEINRGNIAKIFGELITLIEPSKRVIYDPDGKATEGVELTLPYSGKPFGVPKNLDIYGTMNTADRSIALLDTALRRRFDFVELMPQSSVIKGANSQGIIEDETGKAIDLRLLLDTMNKRIRFLLHRDSMLGHSFFCGVKDMVALRKALACKVLPLLQEYFYSDWSRISLVLKGQLMVEEKILEKEVLGFDHDDYEDRTEYNLVKESEITGEMVRKIYQ